MIDIVLIARNLRSSHNVGSLLRTAEGLAVNRVLLSGYTPYPIITNDERLPHLSQKIDKQIAKTALGAEKMIDCHHITNIETSITGLKTEGYAIIGLEQSETSIALNDFQPPEKLALIVGREVEGLEPEIVALCDNLIEIPMLGQKESFNVVQAAAIAMYQLRFAGDKRFEIGDLRLKYDKILDS